MPPRIVFLRCNLCSWFHGVLVVTLTWFDTLMRRGEEECYHRVCRGFQNSLIISSSLAYPCLGQSVRDLINKKSRR